MGGRGLAWGKTSGSASCLTEPCRAWNGRAAPTIHPNRERSLPEAPGRTKACRRRLPASARASLPLLAAAHRGRYRVAGKESEEPDGEGKRAPERARRQGQKGVFCPGRRRLGHSRVVDRTNPPQHTPYASSAAVFALVQSGIPLH